MRIGVHDPDNDRRAAILDRLGLELAAGQDELVDPRRHAHGGLRARRRVLPPRRLPGDQGQQQQQARPSSGYGLLDRRIVIGLLVRASCGA